MNPEQWERLQELVERASQLPRSEHAAFLERECPEPELRAEALSMAQYAFEDSMDLEETVRTFPGEKLPDLGAKTTAITDWSSDGKQLAGFVGASGIVTFDVGARTYRQWTETGARPHVDGRQQAPALSRR